MANYKAACMHTCLHYDGVRAFSFFSLLYSGQCYGEIIESNISLDRHPYTAVLKANLLIRKTKHLEATMAGYYSFKITAFFVKEVSSLTTFGF